MPVNTSLDPNAPQPYANVQEQIDAFNRRKTEDMKRFTANSSLQRRKPFHDRYQRDEFAPSESDESEPLSGNDSDEGEESWRNAEGERLRDFGVDEEAEFYDEEDIPLGVLLQQRRQQQSSN
jgi:palmitoyltransferase